MWGGATFDVAMRFLHEDPWERLRKLRAQSPTSASRCSSAPPTPSATPPTPTTSSAGFVEAAAQRHGHLPHLRLPQLAPQYEGRHGGRAAETGRVCEAAICYTGDILDPKRDKYPLAYYVRMAKELERWAPTSSPSRTWPASASPTPPSKLVKALKDEVGLPIHFHTHDTSGVAAASILKAAEAGVDVVDGASPPCPAPPASPTSTPSSPPSSTTPRDTGLDFDALNRASDYWETVRAIYAPFDSAPRSGAADVYLHEMPGGQYTNLREQAESMGLGPRWPEIARMYADVNRAFGDIVKVTPSSKVVGDLALFLIQHGISVHEFENLPADHSLNIPNSVVEMFEGSLGEPEGGWPKKIARVILRGGKPRRGRPGARLAPANFDETRALIDKKPVPNPLTPTS
jgi:pyruvate carboxylase